MTRSRAVVTLVLLLAVATASCRLSLAADETIAAILGRDLRGFIARAGNLFRSDGGAWRAANLTAAEAKNLRAATARKSSSGGRAGCVSAAACGKRRVICGKRCSDVASSRAASLSHVPSRCVVKCRECVPTC
ncbi:uncharacterized protein LOC100277206 precursor [Zea mays]|uniref:Uncharacterized protein n=1 Tax=Zea mays TaxID=4577 RepID=C0P400_MAIZE|nr:uncharacterized protein LOC100277206 precursor [Zea mays]ACN27716.1 unknown [Zea mays]ONM15538.1 hypothetical protein ZEAMMB73_Zm00001d002872 [Zea mays]|eukprot:NP_001144314.1 uncharacterized protein LOC100277206 precursor [Zea mays]